MATRDYLFDQPKPKPEKDTWYHSKAKKLLQQLLTDGTIPLSSEEMGPRAVYDSHPEFSKFPYERFRANLARLRSSTGTEINVGKSDHTALLQDRVHYPIPTHNAAGVLRWAGSEAEAMMKLDVHRYLDDGTKPEEIFASRAVYQPFGLKKVREHIHQEIKRLKMNKSHYGTRRL